MASIVRSTRSTSGGTSSFPLPEVEGQLTSRLSLGSAPVGFAGTFASVVSLIAGGGQSTVDQREDVGLHFRKADDIRCLSSNPIDEGGVVVGRIEPLGVAGRIPRRVDVAVGQDVVHIRANFTPNAQSSSVAETASKRLTFTFACR